MSLTNCGSSILPGLFNAISWSWNLWGLQALHVIRWRSVFSDSKTFCGKMNVTLLLRLGMKTNRCRHCWMMQQGWGKSCNCAKLLDISYEFQNIKHIIRGFLLVMTPPNLIHKTTMSGNLGAQTWPLWLQKLKGSHGSPNFRTWRKDCDNHSPKCTWLVVWNFFNVFFPYIRNNHSNWLVFSQRGWNHQPGPKCTLLYNPFSHWAVERFDLKSFSG